MKITACIFDLDGVIVDTAGYHFQAWKQTAENLGVSFDEHDNEQLKGVGRMDSLNYILDKGNISKTEAEKKQLAHDKNEHYKTLITNMDASEILPGVVSILDQAEKAGYKIALGSASKNARMILKKTGLIDRFEFIVDGNGFINGKPDPEVFLNGAKGLNVSPSETIVFEDSLKGVQAAISGGFYAVGIGAPEILKEAHIVINDFKNITLTNIIIKIQQAIIK